MRSLSSSLFPGLDGQLISVHLSVHCMLAKSSLFYMLVASLSERFGHALGDALLAPLIDKGRVATEYKAVCVISAYCVDRLATSLTLIVRPFALAIGYSWYSIPVVYQFSSALLALTIECPQCLKIQGAEDCQIIKEKFKCCCCRHQLDRV